MDGPLLRWPTKGKNECERPNCETNNTWSNHQCQSLIDLCLLVQRKRNTCQPNGVHWWTKRIKSFCRPFNEPNTCCEHKISKYQKEIQPPTLRSWWKWWNEMKRQVAFCSYFDTFHLWHILNHMSTFTGGQSQHWTRSNQTINGCTKRLPNMHR